MRTLESALACLVVLACVPNAKQSITPQRAVAALARVRGRFAEVGDNAFVLLGATATDNSTLRQVAALEAAVVPTLIDCLADTSPARVEYAGVPASVGAVCFSALLETRFVQERLGRDGDTNPAASGWVSYRAIEPAQQQRARAEWRVWFARQMQD